MKKLKKYMIIQSPYDGSKAVNSGLRSIYENRCEWLNQLIHAASQYQKIMENSKCG